MDVSPVSLVTWEGQHPSPGFHYCPYFQTFLWFPAQLRILWVEQALLKVWKTKGQYLAIKTISEIGFWIALSLRGVWPTPKAALPPHVSRAAALWVALSWRRRLLPVPGLRPFPSVTPVFSSPLPPLHFTISLPLLFFLLSVSSFLCAYLLEPEYIPYI